MNAQRTPLAFRKKKTNRKQGLDDIGVFDSFLSTSTRLSGAAFILTAISWFYGWRYSEAYFTRIGASWVLTTLSTGSLVQHGAAPIITVAVAAYLLVDGIVHHGWKNATFRRWPILLVVSIFVLGIVLENFYTVPGLLIQAMAMYASLSLVGWCIVLLALEYSNNGAKLTTKALTMIYFVLYLGLYQGPAIIGRLKADIDFKTEGLPKVGVLRANPAETWRLVEMIGERALIHSGGTPRAAARFRLVELKEISIEDRMRSTKGNP